MRRFIFLIVCNLILLGASTACTQDAVTQPVDDNEQQETNTSVADSTSTDHSDFSFVNKSDLSLTLGEREVNQAVNKFAVDYFAKVSQMFDKTFDNPSDKSFSVSPLSATLCLAMMANSTDDATSGAISKMISNSDLNTFSTLCGKLIDYLPYEGNGARMTLANSVWYDITMQPSKDYVATMKDLMNSDVYSIDFNGTEAAGIINKWCSDKTEGLINDMVRYIDPKTVEMLINAMYFEGIWESKFDKSKSFESNFYGIDKTSAAVMMADSRVLTYSHGEDFQSVSLPFGGGITEMVLVLPDKGVDIVNYCNNIDADKFNRICGADKKARVNLTMPKFIAKSYGNIKPALVALGLPETFTLDKSGIAYYDKIEYSVVQQTFSQFDEDGGKMAAVTMDMMVTSDGNIQEPESVTIDFNRPFLYFVRNVSSGTILMAGRVCDI
jgi:serpin B